MRILLVDDHDILREGLCTLLQSRESIRVAASVGSADEALLRVDQESFDVAIVDLSLPDRNGLWLLRKLRAVRPELPVLMLSMHSDRDSVVQALSSGASGYLTKSTDREEMFAALDAVVSGTSYIQDRLAPTVIEALKEHRTKSYEPLSDREMEVLRLVARGESNQSIANAMCVSVSSVKSYLRSLFHRLEVATRTELVVTALNVGLIRKDEL